MATADLPPVSHLSVEAKRKLLAILAQDLVATTGGDVTVLDVGGGVLIYHDPAVARTRAEQAMRAETPEERAEYDRRIANIDQTFSLEEALDLPDDPEPEPK
jgi:hypothetical protein